MKIIAWEYDEGLYRKTAYNMDTIIEWYKNYKGNHGWLKTYSARKKAHERYRYINRFINPFWSVKLSMLDVGCGEGDTMREFQKHGWDTYGVEYSLDHIEKAGRWAKTIFKVNEVSEDLRFNVIVMGHSVEHQENPKMYLHQYLQMLKPNGVMYIEVPNSPRPEEVTDEELINRLLLNYSHLYEFTPESLSYIISMSSGTVVDIQRMTIDHSTRWCKEVGYMMLTARFPYTSIRHIIPACAVIVWVMFKSLFTGTLQKQIPVDSPYMGYADYIRAIVK